MNNIELYIQNTDGDYLPIDIFDNENIKIEDSIQDVRDIGKIFNTFTRDFKVPASFENNKLFKHYYNINIDNGFDARVKTRAIIKVGGVDYKKGYLRLLKVGLNNSKPSFYKLTFQGLITSLKDVLGDDKLGDLDYNDLTFTNNAQVVVDAIRDGLYVGGSAEQDANGDDLYPDVIYAPIFSKAKVVAIPHGSYSTDSNSSEPQGGAGSPFSLVEFTGEGDSNVSVVNDNNSTFKHLPITPYDFKPSIKMGRILKMINSKYGLNIQDEFIQKEEIDQLYMAYNGERKESEVTNSNNAFANNASSNTSVQSSSNSVTYTTQTGSFAPSVQFPRAGGATYTNLLATTGSNGFEQLQMNKGIFYVTSNTSDANISFVARQFYFDSSGERHNLTVETITDSSVGSHEIIGIFNMPQSYYDANIAGRRIYFDVTVNSSKELSGDLSIRFDYQEFQGYFDDGNGGQTNIPDYDEQEGLQITAASSSFLDLSGRAPEIKILDVLTGLFKMFNMTAFINDDEQLVIQNLESFYNDGGYIDLTRNVVVDSHSVSNGFDFKNVNMSYEESKDVMTSNYTTTLGVGFGDIRVNKESFIGNVTDNNSIKGGKDYNIKLPFERMMFENLCYSWSQSSLLGVFTGDPTDLVIGNQIDDKLEQIETKPIIFYGRKIDTTDQGSKSNGGMILTNQQSIASTNDYGLATNNPITHNGSDIGDLNTNKWWNVSGIMASDKRRDGITNLNALGMYQGLSFNNINYDEYDYNQAPQDFILGLYQTNYESYLKGIYSKNYKLTNYKIRLTPSIISKYKLNDTIQVGTNQYYINKLSFNILTGEGDIELINKTDLSLS